MRILVNCYACSPYKGSEPGMGWNFVSSLAESNELHIITEKKFQTDITHYLQENPNKNNNLKFYFIEKERHKRLRIIWPPSYYWFYRKWQKEAYKLAIELIKKYKFDIIHQLNMVGYREPGYLWKIENIPFVWGPIGGFNITPWNMLPSMGVYGAIFYGCRNTLNLWQMHTMGRVKKAMKRANAIIAATQDCQNTIKRLYNRNSTIISEVGIVNHTIIDDNTRINNNKLRICWSGQHTPGKSLNLLIEAMSLLKNKDIELHVIGKGRETKRWQNLAKKLKIDNIIWHGWVQRSEALRIMQSAHAFVITSMCDLTSTVILEALSCALPVVTVDHCGFSNVINENCGIKIPVNNKNQIITDLAKAIDLLFNNEKLRQHLSENALKRATDFSWEKKTKEINHIYKQIIKHNEIL